MTTPYDLTIIGGGIYGSSSALLASLAQKKVILLERNDFGSQTSGNSTKLLHGGLRYLQTLDLGLVFEGLKERSRILNIATKQAKARPLRLIIPVYKNSLKPFWMIVLGTFAYDLLSWLGLPSSKKDFPFSGNLKKEDFSAILKTEGLKGLRYYYDGQIDDRQLVNDEIFAAKINGAKAKNFSEVTSISFDREQKIYTIKYQDIHKKEEVTIQSKKIINCAGPWVKQIDEFAGIDPNIELDYVAGSHIVVDKRISEDGFFIMTKGGRNIFVLPWENNTTLIGTTEERIHEQDIFNNNISNKGKIPNKWRNYLIKNYNEFFQQQISTNDIVDSYWGIRVLIKKKGRSANKTSRKEKIIEHLPGFISLYGGKLTTHLAIATKIFKKLFKENIPKIPKL